MRSPSLILDQVEHAVHQQEAIPAALIAEALRMLEGMEISSSDPPTARLYRVLRQALMLYVSSDIDVRQGAIATDDRRRASALLISTIETVKSVCKRSLIADRFTSSRRKVALAVVPDVQMLSWMAAALTACQLRVHTESSVAGAMKWIEREDPLDLLVAGIELPDGSGVALAARCKRANPDVGLVLIGGPSFARLASLEGILIAPVDRACFDDAVIAALGWSIDGAHTRSIEDEIAGKGAGDMP